MTQRDSFRSWLGPKVQGRNPYPPARDPDEIAVTTLAAIRAMDVARERLFIPAHGDEIGIRVARVSFWRRLWQAIARWFGR